MQVEKVSEVALDFDGAPVSFMHEGLQYTVCAKPTLWYSRKRWWQEATAAPRGSGAMLVEEEMWRLWAIADGNRVLFEMRHAADDSWEIYRVDS